jgi:hypothetical protein
MQKTVDLSRSRKLPGSWRHWRSFLDQICPPLGFEKKWQICHYRPTGTSVVGYSAMADLASPNEFRMDCRFAVVTPVTTVGESPHRLKRA